MCFETPETGITGITINGETVQIFKNGNLVL